MSTDTDMQRTHKPDNNHLLFLPMLAECFVHCYILGMRRTKLEASKNNWTFLPIRTLQLSVTLPVQVVFLPYKGGKYFKYKLM